MQQMIKIHPCRIKGKWREGYALDFHTTKSVFMGYDEYGHRLFDTTYSEVGDLLYRLKYRRDLSVKELLVETIVDFIRAWKPAVEFIVPVPPTRADRSVQPVLILSEAIGAKLGISVASDCIRKVGKISELKEVFDFEERRKLLEGAFEVK
jgi:predicted amidophosphoribosyltransferase